MYKRQGIPFYLFPITKENKKEQEKAEMELLEKHNINFIVLARYIDVYKRQLHANRKRPYDTDRRKNRKYNR